MIMESKPAFGLEQEDDTNSSTECADEEDDVHDADHDDDEDEEGIDSNNNSSSSNEDNLNDDSDVVIPSNFICPLTLEIMKDPLISRHGQSYERRAIMEWIHQGNSTCPMTRQPLRLSGLITNHALKVQIELWKKENNYNSKKNNTSNSQATNSNKTKKKKKKQESTERILGMYCNFLEETTDRSRDDPPMILEWRRPASFDEETPTITTRRSTSTNNTIRNFFTRFRSKHNSNNTTPTTMV